MKNIPHKRIGALTMPNKSSSTPEDNNRGKVPVILSEAGRRFQVERARRLAEEKKRASNILHEHESLKQQAEFPVEALGTTLAEGARAIAKIIQCPLSMAAGVVLVHAAAAVQGIADVRTSKGKLLTSIAVLSIVESSEGKTGAEKIANKPFEDYEKELREAPKEQMRAFVVTTGTSTSHLMCQPSSLFVLSRVEVRVHARTREQRVPRMAGALGHWRDGIVGLSAALANRIYFVTGQGLRGLPLRMSGFR